MHDYILHKYILLTHAHSQLALEVIGMELCQVGPQTLIILLKSADYTCSSGHKEILFFRHLTACESLFQVISILYMKTLKVTYNSAIKLIFGF